MSEQTDAKLLRQAATLLLEDGVSHGAVYLSDRLRAIAARLEAEQWQPIETAPRSGSVLVWVPGYGPFKNSFPYGRQFRNAPPATHWRPLPAPPEGRA